MAKNFGTSMMALWRQNAARLAEWAMARCVNRHDASGAYWIKDGAVCSYTDKRRPVTIDRLIQHFSATDCTSLIGLHALSPTNQGLWAAVDIDVHEGDEVNEERTTHYVSEVVRRLRRFKPLVTQSNGKGGFHVRVFFSEPVEGEVLYRFARWMTHGWQYALPKQPEYFPKQPAIEEGKYGNWLRMPGRHHKRDFWPVVFTETGELGYQESIDAIVRANGISPTMIPVEVFFEDKPKVETRRWEMPTGGGQGKPWEEFDRLADWESLLSSWGWSKCRATCGEITYWTRPGKSDGISGSLGHRSAEGKPLFFCFTSNADPLPPWRYYTPSQAWTYYEHSGNFKQASRDLRSKGYGQT